MGIRKYQMEEARRERNRRRSQEDDEEREHLQEDLDTNLPGSGVTARVNFGKYYLYFAEDTPHEVIKFLEFLTDTTASLDSESGDPVILMDYRFCNHFQKFLVGDIDNRRFIKTGSGDRVFPLSPGTAERFNNHFNSNFDPNKVFVKNYKKTFCDIKYESLKLIHEHFKKCGFITDFFTNDNSRIFIEVKNEIKIKEIHTVNQKDCREYEISVKNEYNSPTFTVTGYDNAIQKLKFMRENANENNAEHSATVSYNGTIVALDDGKSVTIKKNETDFVRENENE
jgi:hypothetical protein